MYLIYMALCIIAWPVVYFYVPETTKIPVEELGAIFGDEVIVHLSADGHELVEHATDLKVDRMDSEDGPVGLSHVGEKSTAMHKEEIGV